MQTTWLCDSLKRKTTSPLKFSLAIFSYVLLLGMLPVVLRDEQQEANKKTDKNRNPKQ
jgi:hypothetical protein